MFIKSSVILIYEGQGIDEDGSPVLLEKRSDPVMCDDAETFSNDYYNDQERSMRLSRNLVVPTWRTEDICEYDTRYELRYVEYLGKRYKVKNILKYKANRYSKGKTRQKMLLDIEEVL